MASSLPTIGTCARRRAAGRETIRSLVRLAPYRGHRTLLIFAGRSYNEQKTNEVGPSDRPSQQYHSDARAAMQQNVQQLS